MIADRARSAGRVLVLDGATIYPDPVAEPIPNGRVIVRDGRIDGVGTRSSLAPPLHAEFLDCAGAAITAGFWHNHAHLFERKWSNASEIPAPELERQLRDMFTRYGFTNVFDTGSVWENTRQIRDRIESGEVSGPRIRSTGEALIAPGAMPDDRLLAVLGLMPLPAPEIADTATARAAARGLLDAGVDALKIHLQPPPPPNPRFPTSAIPVVVEEAHRARKPVFVHPHDGDDVMTALNAGVDIIAHTTPQSGPWNPTMLAEVEQTRVALTPTLTLWRSVSRHDRVSLQDELVGTSIEQLRAWLAAGGTVLYGTDAGAVDYDPVEEYVSMSEAGMSFRDILASLTTAPAERFGDSGRTGRIAPGQDADLVVLEADPAEQLRALGQVRYTFREGKPL